MFFLRCREYRLCHSFPTRRSSDLAPVVAAEGFALFGVTLFLAGNAQLHARQGFLSRGRNRLIAFQTGCATFARGEARAHPRQTILDRAFYLVVNGTVPCPATGHQEHALARRRHSSAPVDSGCRVMWSMPCRSSRARLISSSSPNQRAGSSTMTWADSALRPLVICHRCRSWTSDRKSTRLNSSHV